MPADGTTPPPRNLGTWEALHEIYRPDTGESSPMKPGSRGRLARIVRQSQAILKQFRRDLRATHDAA